DERLRAGLLAEEGQAGAGPLEPASRSGGGFWPPWTERGGKNDHAEAAHAPGLSHFWDGADHGKTPGRRLHARAHRLLTRKPFLLRPPHSGRISELRQRTVWPSRASAPRTRYAPA